MGVLYHCFPPPLDVPTFAATCLCVLSDARDPSSERISDFHVNLGIFYMPQIYDMGPTALLPLRRKASAGFEPANLGTKGQHATSRPPKPFIFQYESKITVAERVVLRCVKVLDTVFARHFFYEGFLCFKTQMCWCGCKVNGVPYAGRHSCRACTDI